VGGGDKTVVSELHIYGTPVAQVANMQEFRRVCSFLGINMNKMDFIFLF
jgi:hypothetical protein